MINLLFLLTGLLIGGGVVWLIYRGRLRNLSEHQRLFERVVQERTESERRLLDSQWEKLQQQIHHASEVILKERSEQLTTTNLEQLSQILQPLQQHIALMKQETQQMRHDHSISLERLDATIQKQLAQEKEMEEQAKRLADALTGNQKVQGNFGELRLKQLLIKMGFEEGLQYDEQTTLRDAKGRVVESQGRRLIPDVVLHFPDHRDVVIDSKVSLTAFVDYQNASTPEEQSAALQRHLQSLKAHIKELSQKQYHRYTGGEGGVKLDFVIMYVFHDAALELAMQHEAQLWNEAASQGVILCGSRQLFVTLRVLELSWQQALQVENQEKIMQCASTLVERVQLFAERAEGVNQMLKRTWDQFQSLQTVIAPSGMSIITTARQLLQYGAQENPRRPSLRDYETTDEEPEAADS